MATLLTSGRWEHNAMWADIMCKLYYEITSRSGSSITVRLTSEVSLVPPIGSSSPVDNSSGYAYAIYSGQGISSSAANSSQSHELEIQYGGYLKDTTFKGTTSLSQSYDYTFTVGTSSGSISVSASFYSDNRNGKIDTDGCATGPTVYGSFSYDSTNSAPPASAWMSPSDGYYNGAVPLSWAAVTDPDAGDTVSYHIIVSKNSWGNWLDAITNKDWSQGLNTVSSTSYNYDISGDPEGTRYYFGVQAVDNHGATSGWTHPNGGTMTIYKNKSPYMPSNVATSASYATNSVSVSWTNNGDPEGQTVSFKVKVYRNDVYYTAYDASASPLSYSFPSGDAADTKYTFGVIAIDSIGSMSNEATGGLCRKAVAPNPPTSVWMSNKYGISSVTVNWSGATVSCAGQPISGYYVYGYKQVPGQGLVGAGQWNTGSTQLSMNIDSDPCGTLYKFKISAYTSLSGTIYEGSTSIDSDVAYKDSPANAPTNIGIYDSNNSARLYFVPSEKIRIIWSGASDPDSDQTLAYFVSYKKCTPGSNWTGWNAIGSGYTTTNQYYDFTMDSNDPRGTQYQFQVTTAGIVAGTAGFQSSPLATANVAHKNQIPNNATGLAPVQDSQATYLGSSPNKYVYEDSITLNWTAATANDSNQVQTYSIYVKKAAPGSGSYTDWQYIASGISGTSYTVSETSFSGDQRGMQYQFGIVTSDGLESSGTSAASIICKKNSVPSAPIMNYPVNGAIIYDMQPRTAITISNELDSQGQILYVVWRGTEYNSKDHASYFSTSGNAMAAGDHVVFKAPTQGVIGANSVSIRTTDGCASSTTNTYTINIAAQNFISLTQNVTQYAASMITESRTAVNNVRAQYGISAYTFSTTAASGNYIRMQDMVELRAAVDDIRNLLNGWDNRNTALDNITAWSSLISQGNIFFDKFRVQADANSFIDVDDSSAGITFNGIWSTRADSNDLGGSSRVSNAIGSVVYYSFSGIGIEWYGDVDITAGKAKVTVDSMAPVYLDLCTKHSRHQSMLFHKLDMANGQHTIRIEVLGGSNLYADVSYFTEFRNMLANL